MARVVRTVLTIPPERTGCVVEAGCFKGGSTVKLSIACGLAGRRLVVFDSFEGLPLHREPHGQTIFGEQTRFVPGLYAGALEEVTSNVRRFGELAVCRFIKGWFNDTMPSFHEPVVAAFIDVDLAASTRTCLQYLYPLLIPGGVIFSHDGHLPLCMEVFGDRLLWAAIGGPPPVIAGLGTQKLIAITKPRSSDGAETG
jgi:O-methyltransferase